MHLMPGEPVAQQAEQFVQRRSFADRDVIDLVLRIVSGKRRAQVRLDRVGDVAEVATGRAVAVDFDFAAGDHGRDPLGDHRGIGSFRVLLGAEDVEIAQPDRREIIASRIDRRIDFIGELGRRVG
jgi:hypothetical protein